MTDIQEKKTLYLVGVYGPKVNEQITKIVDILKKHFPQKDYHWPSWFSEMSPEDAKDNFCEGYVSIEENNIPVVTIFRGSTWLGNELEIKAIESKSKSLFSDILAISGIREVKLLSE